MYNLLGGDLTKIQDASDLEQLQSKSEELVQRGRGRPKKYVAHVTVNVVQKKLRKFEEKENYAFSSSLLAKKKRKSQLYSQW
jgi:2'-5' RNA ligase